MINKILVPLDGSGHTARTIEFASNIARQEDAASYVPKDKMTEIPTYLNDILEAKEKGMHFWWRWLDRFGSFFEKRFGTDWRKSEEDFLNEF